MQKVFFILLLLANYSLLFAQTDTSNKWIRYTDNLGNPQKYFKIPITKEGIYRISQPTLANAGFPLGSIDSKSIQLFYRGQEQYIYLYGESNGTLNTNGYIEFYAKGNDGWLDSLLFEPSTDITNPYYSMYTDTSYYFLTWDVTKLGKRVGIETDVNFAAYTSQISPYCMVDVLYQNPTTYFNGLAGPRYRINEGWFESAFGLGYSTSANLSTPGSTNSIPSVLNICIAGCSNANALSFNHHLRITLNPSLTFDTSFYGYNTIKKTFTINQILSSNSNVTFSSINDLGVATDYMALSYTTLTYSRNFNFQGLLRQNFRINDSNNSKSLIEIDNFGSANTVLWDLTNHKRINNQIVSGKLKALVPNSGGIKTCYIADDIYIISTLYMKTFTDYSSNNYNKSDYIIITNPLLISGANSYKTYRNSTGYIANCYDIEQLYDQFAYGIKKHPLAIKNFLKFISSTYDSVPKYVFLIGKSIHSGGIPSECFRKNSTYFSQCLIPSFGTPSSDNLLATNILSSGNGLTQDLPIGRLAATTNTEVNDYLNKVMTHEFAPAAEWMKRVIHFGGGTNTVEQSLFQGYLLGMENIIEDTLYGAHVETFLKTTSLPVQISVADSVHSLINDGCSIISFFGHGSTGSFDQNIQNPADYNNQGKYPLLLANSCLAGDIHLPAPKKIAEEWVLIPNKGSIAFIASVDLGYASYLKIFSDELYKQITYKNYTHPLGKCFCDGNKAIISASGNNDYIVNTCLEFTLHGDPAVSVRTFNLPDLTISSASIGFVPGILTSEAESFDVRIIVTNIGKAFTDAYKINIARTFPDGSIENYSKIFYGVYYKDTVYINIPTDYIRGPGVNQFCVTVDSEDWIHEMSETNNYACTNITIRTSDLTPVYPYEFAIFPNDTVTLKASTGYPFNGTQTYTFEIDTTDLFNSPKFESGIVSQSGGVVTWTPHIITPLIDSTVYFWRVSAVPQGSATPKWKESSFTYISGKTGWSQAHFFQFKKDGFEAINYDSSARKLDFVTAPKSLSCHVVGSAGNQVQFDETKYWLDAITDYSSCYGVPSILVVVIDPMTMKPWESNRADYGHNDYPQCRPARTNKYLTFTADTPHLESLATFLNTTVPDSFYILAYTFISGNFQLWPANTKQAFLNLGAVQFQTLPNNYPCIFYTKKGTGSVREIAGTFPNEILDFDTLVPTQYTSGHVRSTKIGPSTKWETLHWRQFSQENPTKDKVHLALTGFKPNNDSLVLMPNIPNNNLDIYDLYNYADATTYPYLNLSMFTQDDSIKTPSQLKRWQITYDGAPETAINPFKGQYFDKDTLQEGNTLTFAVATENISEYNMDSLLVRYWVQNKNNQLVSLGYKRLRPHPSGDVLIDTIEFNTTGYSGLNHIWYEVNPVNTSTSTYDQLEQYHFNNFAEKAFYVSSDITNPLLDVTFDGMHIMNGDIVSAKPYILTTLKDENKFLALNDTSLFGIYLTSLSTGAEKRIYFNSSEIIYTKAQLPNNSFKIEYKPILADGKYQLRIQAKDVSNNESGSIDYKINFEVINKSTITNIFNYPNPFSSSTRFVFTLTGSEVPDDLRIQIMTITGKFVREIHLEELGPIHIGNNITQFTWNGTDTYGDKLANGVYFFRVFAKLDNETIEHRDTDADKFFKEGFGKMYILR